MGAVNPTLAMIPDARERAALEHAWQWLSATVSAGATLHADSRRVGPGDVFVAYAVKGADSRGFIADAVERGAAAVIWQSDDFTWPAAITDVPQLGVPNLDWLAGPLASLWYGEPSVAMTMFGVTGTNGKTSCSQWLAQLLTKIGTRSAVIGTLGSGFPSHLTVTGFTTPDAVQLQRSLADLRAQGAAAVAMEVSSHGLYQGRVNGVAFGVAVFTNLTQDHLDYHGTMAEYEAAKTRLFDWVGLKGAVINRDDAMGQRLLARLAANGAGTTVYEYGLGGDATSVHGNHVLRAEDIRATTAGTRFTLHVDAHSQQITVPLIGDFNISNALAVLGAALAANLPLDAAVAALTTLTPVSGRMEQIGQPGQPLVVIDYAHTPDALDKTLAALRPVADARGGKLVCVFGCGGNRDAGKRPQMGAAAERLADALVLTSDNPRSEVPADIMAQIAAGLAKPDAARRIEDRASAILQAVRTAQAADVVLVAGKGHESTQEIMGKKRPFSDQEHARLALAARATASRGGGE